MAAKPLSLADRIRAQRKVNRSESEVNAEKELVRTITAVDSKTTQEVEQKTVDRSSDQLIKRSTDQVDNQSSNQPLDHLIDQLTGQLTNQLINRSTDQVDNYKSDQLINRSTDQVDPKNREQKHHNLTERQYAVLKFIFFNRPFKVHGLNGMGNILGIGAPNIRNQLKSLINKGFIYKPYSINDGVNVGSTCRVVEKKCKPLFGNTDVINPPKQKEDHLNLTIWSSNHMTNQSTNQVVNQSSDQPHYQSSDQLINKSTNQATSLISSSSLNKTTTNSCSQIETHPELGYWQQKGLKPKQIETWSNELDLSEADIIQSLCYCKFDMVDNGKEEKDNIEDVFSWFYKIVQKAGAYPKPKNYKSHQEMLIEREKARLAEIKKQAEELRKIRQEAIKASYELEFEKMLQNSEDPIYQQCHETLPSVLKKRKKSGSIAFVNAMKAAFCKLNDIEDC